MRAVEIPGGSEGWGEVHEVPSAECTCDCEAHGGRGPVIVE